MKTTEQHMIKKGPKMVGKVVREIDWEHEGKEPQYGVVLGYTSTGWVIIMMFDHTIRQEFIDDFNDCYTIV